MNFQLSHVISREVVRNSAEILMFLGRQILGEGSAQFLTEFYKPGSSSNML